MTRRQARRFKSHLGTKMLCKTHNRIELVKKSDGWTVVLACGCERTGKSNVPVELMPNEPLTAEELRRICNLNPKKFPASPAKPGD